ncbi:MAG TPA: hypothetical protein VI504_00110 [Candidatus Eisenbacteria bacterium]
MHSVRFPPRPIGAARLVPTPTDLRPEWKHAWPWLFWALWGAWLAVSDLRSDDLQPAVFRMLLGAAVLGAAQRRRWWLWSLALAAWVPAEPIVAAVLRTTPGYETNSGVWILPPLTALVGGFLGRGIAASALAHRKPE